MKKPKKPALDSFDMLFEDLPKTKSNRGNIRKYLTNRKKWSIIERVKKLKRKDDNKMAKDKIKNNKKNYAYSIAWLAEVSFRVFAGWVLLNNFDHIVTTIAALYALGTGAVVVIAHFFNAHK